MVRTQFTPRSVLFPVVQTPFRASDEPDKLEPNLIYAIEIEASILAMALDAVELVRQGRGKG